MADESISKLGDELKRISKDMKLRKTATLADLLSFVDEFTKAQAQEMSAVRGRGRPKKIRVEDTESDAAMAKAAASARETQVSSAASALDDFAARITAISQEHATVTQRVKDLSAERDLARREKVYASQEAALNAFAEQIVMQREREDERRDREKRISDLLGSSLLASMQTNLEFRQVKEQNEEDARRVESFIDKLSDGIKDMSDDFTRSASEINNVILGPFSGIASTVGSAVSDYSKNLAKDKALQAKKWIVDRLDSKKILTAIEKQSGEQGKISATLKAQLFFAQITQTMLMGISTAASAIAGLVPYFVAGAFASKLALEISNALVNALPWLKQKTSEETAKSSTAKARVAIEKASGLATGTSAVDRAAGGGGLLDILSAVVSSKKGRDADAFKELQKSAQSLAVARAAEKWTKATGKPWDILDASTKETRTKMLSDEYDLIKREVGLPHAGMGQVERMAAESDIRGVMDRLTKAIDNFSNTSLLINNVNTVSGGSGSDNLDIGYGNLFGQLSGMLSGATE